MRSQVADHFLKFASSVHVHFVESSVKLREAQMKSLGVTPADSSEGSYPSSIRRISACACVIYVC